MNFETIAILDDLGQEIGMLQRSKVIGGWFVRFMSQAYFGNDTDTFTQAAFFYPDPLYLWTKPESAKKMSDYAS